MSIYPKEAWIHNPESRTTDVNHKLLRTLLYGSDVDITNVNVGFQKFLARVRGHGMPVPLPQIVYFYNRQTIIQIFFRFPTGSRRRSGKSPNANLLGRSTIPLRRAGVAHQNLQIDLFEITTPFSFAGTDRRKRIGLIVVDESTRFLWCGPLKATKSAASVGRLFLKLVPASLRANVQSIKSDNGGEFGEAFDNLVMPEFPAATHTRISKATIGLGHPGPLAPAETAVRTFREYLERYRRLIHTDFFNQEDFNRICDLVNNTPHSAFRNKFTPKQLTSKEMKEQLFTFVSEKYNLDKSKAQVSGIAPLAEGELVRIIRIRAAFTKQSYPNLTYDLYKVIDIQVYLVQLKNIRTSEMHTLHKTRIARVKQPCEDPPDTGVYQGFINRIRNLLKADEDYYLGPANSTPGVNAAVVTPREPERAPELTSAAPSPPRRGGRERRPNTRYVFS